MKGTMEKKQYTQLSTGQKKRLHLALALIGNPDVIFLDEPTAGLDVEGRLSLHEQIRKLKSNGKTIVMASHDMAEVENLCLNALIGHRTRRLSNGLRKNLKKQSMSQLMMIPSVKRQAI